MLHVEGLPITKLRKRSSAKWREYPDDVLPLFVAEMDFEIAQPIRDLLIGMINRSDTGYLGKAPELGENLATFAKSRWNWEIDTTQVFTATDVGVAVVEMARTVLQPGDTILINSPVYHNFYNWSRELKCEIVDAPLKREGLHYTLDFEIIEKAYQSGVRIHFLCNPHNPVGTVFAKAELSLLADLASKYDVAIFSDEVHAPLVFDPPGFTPFLNVSSTAREVGICITAASKSWNLAGLKCATIITASEKWNQRALSMPEAVHYRASLFGAVSAAAAYQCTEWLDAVLETLDRNRKFLQDELRAKLPGVGYRIPDFGYLAWLDLTELNLGDDPTEVILEKARVAFNPGQSFQPGANQFTRLNFGTSKTIITDAINRIAGLVARQ